MIVKNNREDFLKSFGHSILAGMIKGKKKDEASAYIQYQQCKKEILMPFLGDTYNYINNFILKKFDAWKERIPRKTYPNKQ